MELGWHLIVKLFFSEVQILVLKLKSFANSIFLAK
jgi:hypothetical protein